MTLIYLDTETTGLDPLKHEVWEIAYAIGDGPIQSSTVRHFGWTADPKALEIGQYFERGGRNWDGNESHWFEDALQGRLGETTLVGANPRFDAAFLEARWGHAPWKYRLLDIEAYAMPAFGWDVPQGLKNIAGRLSDLGYDIPKPDHTAAGDVDTLRACHLSLQHFYSEAL